MSEVVYLIIGLFVGSGLMYLFLTWPESDERIREFERKQDEEYEDFINMLEEREHCD